MSGERAGAATAGRVFTIPAGWPFIDTLVDGIATRYGLAPETLGVMTVLLPTRRACRVLRDGFLRRTEGAPLVLPRLVPIGDVDAEELAFGAEAVPGLGDAADLPPALPDLRRQLLLAQAILRVPGAAATSAQALRLAAELARLLDEMQTQRLSFSALAPLVPDDHAAHWRITLDFLKVLHEVWPTLLAAEGALDPADRRARSLALQIRLWQAAPPCGPVIAAGSTGSIPATADLIAAVAALPGGAVVLPGVDPEMDDAAWDAIEESHPQVNLARLLAHLKVDRRQIPLWQDGADAMGREAGAAARRRLLAETMRPAATTDAWRSLAPIPPAALAGLGRIDCPGTEEEAGVIALLLREVLETPGRTAALVTPDRTLARRVVALMSRWDVHLDDSGGRPLGDTPVGSFLRLSAACAAARCAPGPLLALCKHPLAAGGLKPTDFRFRMRRLERAALRGPKPGTGLEGIAAVLAQKAEDNPDRAERYAELRAFLDAFGVAIGPFLDLLRGSAPLVEMLRAHITWAERLAASDTKEGAARLWRQEDGEQAAGLLSALLEAAGDFPEVAGRDYPAILEALLATVMVRPQFGQHPRLAVYGPLEARLIHADLVILGGLNEGTWPPEPPADPWLSRPMREQLGLPAPERRIGLSAHDFVQLAAQPTVVLTRSRRVDGTPTVPSRWLSRLDTVLKAVGLPELAGPPRGDRLAWLGRLDEPARVRPWPRPSGAPPVEARPRTLSVSDIELWRRDPYGLYAKKILGLRALEPVGADPGASERGQFIHKALEVFIESYGAATLPADALDRLLGIGRDAFGAYLDDPDVWAFWWPRFERIAAWFVGHERQRRPAVRTVATEAQGRFALPVPRGRFEVTAIADRVDRLADGTLEIIDYKTGRVPSRKEVEAGFAPQLLLEAMIAEAGGFESGVGGAVAALSYWRLTGGAPAAEIKPLPADGLRALIDAAKQGLIGYVAGYDQPDQTYLARPVPDFVPRFSDYDHLERVQEWAAGGTGEGAE